MDLRIGYARVSKHDQHPEGQQDAVRVAGCDRVYVDTASGKLARRPELDKALVAARHGDQLAVTKLDRLGRSLEHLIVSSAGFDGGVDVPRSRLLICGCVATRAGGTGADAVTASHPALTPPAPPATAPPADRPPRWPGSTLTYGAESDWVKNVIAAGGCGLERRGRGLRLGWPRVFHDEARRQVPAIVRPALAVLRVSDFMTLYTDGAPEAADETGHGSGSLM